MNIYQYPNINLTKLFKSLADETRLRIVRVLLKGAFHVNEILFVLNHKQSNISHHLKILQESGIIENKKEGSLIYYHLKDKSELQNIEKIIDAVESEEKKISFYQEDIQRLTALVQKRKKSAEDFFNTIGKDLDGVQDKLFRDIYKAADVVKLFESKMNILLDIGCGTGRNLPVLSKYAGKIIGFDSSPGMLQLSEHICRENKLNYELKLGDINALPFLPESVDGVFMNMVLHHISNPGAAMKEISRILRNSGKLLLIELLAHDNEDMREKYADLWLGFEEMEIIKWIEESGLAVKNKIIKAGNNKEKEGDKPFRAMIALCEKK